MINELELKPIVEIRGINYGGFVTVPVNKEGDSTHKYVSISSSFEYRRQGSSIWNTIPWSVELITHPALASEYKT